MFKNILCATDLSAASAGGVKKAVQLAHQYNSQIIMLNVHEEFMTKEEMRMLRVSIDTIKLEFNKIALDAKKEMEKRRSQLQIQPRLLLLLPKQLLHLAERRERLLRLCRVLGMALPFS